MKYLITGVAGMIGSHLSEIIIQNGHSIIGIDNLQVGNLDNLSEVINDKCFVFHNEDIITSQKLELLIKECDVITPLPLNPNCSLICLNLCK